MNNNFVYLVRLKDKSRFKIGFTINPRARAHQYRSHNLDAEYVGHIEVPNKKYEKLIHYQLYKNQHLKCIIKGNTEWWQGDMNYQEFYNLVTKVIGDTNVAI